VRAPAPPQEGLGPFQAAGVKGGKMDFGATWAAAVVAATPAASVLETGGARTSGTLGRLTQLESKRGVIAGAVPPRCQVYGPLVARRRKD